MAKVGDSVRFLNSVGGGRIVRISGNIAHVEDEDGFETPVLLKEIVVVAEASSDPQKDNKVKSFAPQKPKQETPPATAVKKPEPEPEPVIETPEGEKLNIVLGFEPDNIKELSTTEISAYLVNDSNYYLYFTYSSRSADTEEWTLRYAGMVEPNIQLYMGEVVREMIPQMEKIRVQLIAFKESKEYAGKPAVTVETTIDTTKFFRLHCFKDNIYFDNPVIAVDIVRDDVPADKKSESAVKKLSEREAIREKKKLDRPVRRKAPVAKHSDRRNNDVIECDLHITELLDDIRGLSNADMLNLQIDEFRRVMDSNLRNHGQKIVFIHGKGDGALRNAIMKELKYRYKEHPVQDASFREYGFGATQVTIR